MCFKGQLVKLTPTEEALFYMLVRYAGKVVTSQHLTRCLWGSEAEDKMRDLHVYIGHLRKRLEDDGVRARIKTEGSTGYKLELGSSAASSAHTEAVPLIAT